VVWCAAEAIASTEGGAPWTIDSKSGLPLLDRGQTAVLVVDVQKHFTQVVGPRLFPPVDDVLERMRRFVGDARDAGVPIVRIRIVVTEDTRSAV